MKPRTPEFQLDFHKDFVTTQYQNRRHTVPTDCRQLCPSSDTLLPWRATLGLCHVERRKRKGNMCRMHDVRNNNPIQKHFIALTTLCNSSLLASITSKLLSGLILANRDGNGAQDCLVHTLVVPEIDGSASFFYLFISTGSRYSQASFIYP